jgi:hypothetical protein
MVATGDAGAHSTATAAARSRRTCPPTSSTSSSSPSFKRQYLDEQAVAIVSDEHVSTAETKVANARACVSAAFALADRLGEMSESEQALFDAQLDHARAGLRDAEDELAQARMQARSADLPPMLSADVFDSAPLPERRHWISLVFRCVVVRRGVGYREPVADRARILLVDDAPADSTHLIPYIVGLSY